MPTQHPTLDDSEVDGETSAEACRDASGRGTEAAEAATKAAQKAAPAPAVPAVAMGADATTDKSPPSDRGALVVMEGPRCVGRSGVSGSAAVGAAAGVGGKSMKSVKSMEDDDAMMITEGEGAEVQEEDETVPGTILVSALYPREMGCDSWCYKRGIINGGALLRMSISDNPFPLPSRFLHAVWMIHCAPIPSPSTPCGGRAPVAALHSSDTS